MIKDFRQQIALLAAACLVIGFGGGLLGSAAFNAARNSDDSPSAQRQFISNESELIANIAKEVGQGVVSVEVSRRVNSTDFFGFGVPSSERAAGTGFIIDANGTIVTNRHVVPSGTSSVSITLADGTRYDDVRVIGRTASSSSLDVAFLKIGNTKGKKLEPIKLGDSAKTRVGERVVAIGNALGQFQNTVTSGIISGFGRDVVAGGQDGSSAEALTDLFQTDAAINEGNSGGPLVNVNGEVIGINTAVAGNAQNIGFAIPINDVKGIIRSVLTTGKVEQPFLGVRYVSLTDDLAYQYNLSVKRGAYIVPSGTRSSSIVDGSPAAKAGLREKDIIIKVNNVIVDDKTSLSNALGRFKVGETVALTVIRSGDKITVNVALEAAKE